MTCYKELPKIYSALQKDVERKGISLEKIKDIRQKFFYLVGDKWEARESFWKPTSVVLGYPLPANITKALVRVRMEILEDVFNLEAKDYWLSDPDKLHITVLNYSHYSERKKRDRTFQLSQKGIAAAKKIISTFRPISVNLTGIMLLENGSLLAKGFAENDDLFLMRDQLKDEIEEVSKKQPNIIHSKLAQLLKSVPREKAAAVNCRYNASVIGGIDFDHVKTWSGEKLYFQV